MAGAGGWGGWPESGGGAAGGGAGMGEGKGAAVCALGLVYPARPAAALPATAEKGIAPPSRWMVDDFMTRRTCVRHPHTIQFA